VGVKYAKIFSFAVTNSFFFKTCTIKNNKKIIHVVFPWIRCQKNARIIIIDPFKDFIAHTEKLSRGGLSGKTTCLRMALCVYLFSRGSWKISCQTEKSPLFWSFNPTHMELTLRWSKCFCPRLCKNCTHLIKQSHLLILTSFKEAHISLSLSPVMCWCKNGCHCQFSHTGPSESLCLLSYPDAVWSTQISKSFYESTFMCLWNHLVNMWVHVCVTSDSLWAKREGRVWGKANRKACCLSGLRAGT